LDVEYDGGDHNNNNNISCADIRREMFYGFELSWLNSLCKHGRYAELDQNNQPLCTIVGMQLCDLDTLFFQFGCLIFLLLFTITSIFHTHLLE